MAPCWTPAARAAGVRVSAQALNAFIDTQLAAHGLTEDRLALVGFSQGTMMALHVGLRRKISPAAIVGYSGMVVAPERLPQFPQGGPAVFLQHGDEDQVIPVQALFLSATALGAVGIPVQWRMASGLGHGIDPDGLAIGGILIAAAFAGRLKSPCLPVSSLYPRG